MSRKRVNGREAEVAELREEFFDRARPGSDVVPEVVAVQKGARGRPKAEQTKRSVTVRLDPDVLEYFKAGGRGWQTRLNDALRDYVESHQ